MSALSRHSDSRWNKRGPSLAARLGGVSHIYTQDNTARHEPTLRDTTTADNDTGCGHSHGHRGARTRAADIVTDIEGAGSGREGQRRSAMEGARTEEVQTTEDVSPTDTEREGRLSATDETRVIHQRANDLGTDTSQRFIIALRGGAGGT